jgi:hypothetical protein
MTWIFMVDSLLKSKYLLLESISSQSQHGAETLCSAWPGGPEGP